MSYVTTIWMLPLVLAIWTLNTWLFLAGLRLGLSQLRSTRAVRMAQGLAEFTDGPPAVVGRWLSHYGRPVAQWVPWAIVIAAGLMARHLLLGMILALA